MTTDWAGDFFRHLVSCDGDVSKASDLCGISRDAPYKRRRRGQDPQFAREWEAAERRLAEFRSLPKLRRIEAQLEAVRRDLAESAG